MSPNDNDLPVNDNVVSLADAKKNSTQASAPPPKTFQIVTIVGEEFFQEGYVVATPAFVGVGSIDGTILCVVPLERLSFIREVAGNINPPKQAA